MKVHATCYKIHELNVLCLALPFGKCCNNCIRKSYPANRFETIYDLISFIDTSFGRGPVLYPIGGEGSDVESTTSPKTWGNLHSGNRLTIRRQALETWRFDCWDGDYCFCSFGPVGVMPDAILSKLASFTKIETVDNILKAVSTWGYASRYSHEVLSWLKDADHEHQIKSQTQQAKMRQLNKECKMETDEQQDLGRFTQSGSFPTPVALVHTWMIDPVIVKHVARPIIPQHSRPRPRPTPIHVHTLALTFLTV